MSHLRPAFEKELRFKLTQKTKANHPEDTTLIKHFKYYDLYNTGKVNRDQFTQTIIKVGVNTLDQSEIFQLFDLYDFDKDGAVDYKEFTGIVFGSITGFGKQENQASPNKLLPTEETQIEEALNVLQDKLQGKGINGLVGLASFFRNLQKDNSPLFELKSFADVFDRYHLGLNPKQIERLFIYYDRDADGYVDFEDLLAHQKGKLNQTRKSLVNGIFTKLDQDQDGFVSIEDIKSAFNPAKHPDVIAGSAKAQQVKIEFLDSIESYANYLCLSDGRLNGPEFEDYYTFIGYQIQNDQYFTTLLNNVWRAPESRGSDRKQKPSEQSRVDPDLFRQQIAAFIPRFRQRLALRGPRGFAGLTKLLTAADFNRSGYVKANFFFKTFKDFKVDLSEQDQKTLLGFYDPEKTSELPYQDILRDIVGGLSESRVELADVAWRSLDKQNTGAVHVTKKILSNDKIDDLRNIFHKSRNHPEVKGGKKSEEQIAEEYWEVIYSVHSLSSNPKDPYVTKSEFDNFILYISAACESDQVFELIMLHTFKIRLETNYQETSAGQAGGRRDYNPKAGFISDMHRSVYQGGSVSKNAPFGTTHDTKDSISRPRTAYVEEEVTSRRNFKASPTRESGNKTIEPQRGYDAAVAKQVFTNFRHKFLGRGTRGYYGLLRHFRGLDESDSGALEVGSFLKALGDFRIELPEKDALKIFDFLQVIRGNDVDYEEFLRRTVGELNEFRTKLAVNAFGKLDVEKAGSVPIDLVFAHFDCKNHPDVRFGKKRDDDVLLEFLETFELHHALYTRDPKPKNIPVTLEEFLSYQCVASASIPDDKMYEFITSNCWTAVKPSSQLSDRKFAGKKHYNFYN